MADAYSRNLEKGGRVVGNAIGWALRRLYDSARDASYCQELCMEGSRGVLFNPNAILKSRTVHNLRQVMRSA
jgi:hypothetical protein